MSDEIKISDPMTLREQVARAMDPTGWQWFDRAEAEHPAKQPFLEDQMRRADAAIALITEACAKVAEECANEVDESHVVFYVSERIRQMGKP